MIERRGWLAHLLSPSRARIAGALVAVEGVLVLAGWALGVDVLTSGVPGLATMKANTALSFALCGAALAALASPGRHRLVTLLARGAAALAIVIGFLTLLEYATGRSLGLDTLVFGLAAHAEGFALPGRMSPATSLNFVLLGGAVVLLPTAVAPWLALVPTVLAWVGLAGYLHAALSGGGLLSYTSFALPTAVGFCLLGPGILAARPDAQLTRMLLDRGASGIMARRLLPATLLIPVVMGWARLEAERAGWLSLEVGVGLMVVATIVALTVVAAITARTLDRADARRAAAEERLRESEARYRDLFDSAPVGLCRTSPDGTLMAVNRAFATLLAAPDAEALMGRNVSEVYAEPATRACPEDEAVREAQVRRADGKQVWVEERARARHDERQGVDYCEISVVDITKRKRLEEQFLQAQKMEAVGRLAGGVAHDFNNLLTAINGNAELLREALPADDPRREDVSEILAASERAARLTRQLLAFSRQQVLAPQVLDLNGVVRNMETMLRRIIGEDITLDAVLTPSLGTVRADRGQLEQLILNLAVNARDAMPEGGSLTIETADVQLGADFADDEEEIEPGPYVLLAVTDTGVGIDAETQKRIFEPFFTTKAPRGGTGLGLSTVYGVVHQSGGHVWVYSEVGRGATFKIYLPRLLDPEVPETPRPPRAAPGRAGTETLLLVEDELDVRRVTRRLLEKFGYTVLDASGVEEAIRIAREHPGSIHLVLSDVVLPDGRADALITSLRAVRQDFATVFMSGYTGDTVVRRGIVESGAPFLQKPFSAERLADVVRRALDTRPA